MFSHRKKPGIEDSAIQRRVADLKGRALPTLAAGSAAQTSSPINVSSLPSITGLMRDSASTAQTKAQADLVKMQKEGAMADATVKGFEAGVAEKMAMIVDENGRSGRDILAFLGFRIPWPPQERLKLGQQKPISRRSFEKLKQRMLRGTWTWLGRRV